ncbi:MAG: DUF599 family protein [Methylobacteriaceae bacterium]|nr:DUF599 family protein [Methylobacteriaceae bacterium]
MLPYSADAAALLAFLVAWIGYAHFVKRRHNQRPGLNALMNAQRDAWMREMARRDVRIVDTAITSTLQNGTAFFASTSLIAIGGAATVLRSTDDVVRLFAELPFAPAISRGLWEAKTIGLMAIFGYAFFKFGWAYRLYNYSAILIGATPPAASPDAEARETAARRAAGMSTVAGRHFADGQRALFFSFAYLGWFLGPLVFMLTTALIMVVIYRRQFHSDALDALGDISDADPES